MSDIPSNPNHAATKKYAELRRRGMQPCATVLVDPGTGRRAVVSYWGDVKWSEAEEVTALPATSVDFKSVSVERDSDSMWWHPAVPWERMPDEQDITPYLRVLGYESQVIAMDGDAPDDVIDKYADGDGGAIAEWQPSQPAGDGWFLGAIYDTENGPLALWLRRDIGQSLTGAAS